jgi:acyl-CoA reductase-like NAD-dependent aldehyde dehydrogenase
MSITETRKVGSIIAGQAREEGQRVESRNPANLDELVCEAWLGDAGTFVAACRAAREAQRAWAATPAPVRGKAIGRISLLVEDNKEALSLLFNRVI